MKDSPSQIRPLGDEVEVYSAGRSVKRGVMERGHPVRQRAPARSNSEHKARTSVRASRLGGQDVRAPLLPAGTYLSTMSFLSVVMIASSSSFSAFGTLNLSSDSTRCAAEAAAQYTSIAIQMVNLLSTASGQAGNH